jgi:hypothetical protein
MALRAAVAALGWPMPEATLFSYRLVVERLDSGAPAWAACAESDLDGDGVVQAIVAFGPAPDARGVLAAPAAPCTHQPRLTRPLRYGEGDRPDNPVRASPPEVL